MDIGEPDPQYIYALVLCQFIAEVMQEAVHAACVHHIDEAVFGLVAMPSRATELPFRKGDRARGQVAKKCLAHARHHLRHAWQGVA